MEKVTEKLRKFWDFRNNYIEEERYLSNTLLRVWLGCLKYSTYFQRKKLVFLLFSSLTARFVATAFAVLMTGSQSAKRHKAAGGAERGQQSRAWMRVQALSHADSTPTWPGHHPMKGPNDRTTKRRGPARGRRAETLTTAGRRRGGETVFVFREKHMGIDKLVEILLEIR